jgi:UDP-glucose 4-epimerase
MGGLAEKVRDLVGSTSEIVYVPYDEAYEEGFEDMHRRIPDISKIHDAIGWQPKRNLDQIIHDVKADQQHDNGVHLIAA